jgi:hypothetical protein
LLSKFSDDKNNNHRQKEKYENGYEQSGKLKVPREECCYKHDPGGDSCLPKVIENVRSEDECRKRESESN